jgi:hypothetical protein
MLVDISKRYPLPSEGKGRTFESYRVRHLINDLGAKNSHRAKCVRKTGIVFPSDLLPDAHRPLRTAKMNAA